MFMFYYIEMVIIYFQARQIINGVILLLRFQNLKIILVLLIIYTIFRQN